MTPVPHSRLIWYAWSVMIAAAVAGPLPALRLPVLAVSGVLILIALVDLAWSLSEAQPIQVSVPEVMRLTKDRPGNVSLTLANPSKRAQRVRLGIAWPAAIESPDEERSVQLPADAVHSRIEWACTGRKRGRWSEIMACVETPSRLGFWVLRRRSAMDGELRVYPNLFSEKRPLAALYSAQMQQGALARRAVGRGREFEKLRDYLPGDGFDEIHWKATAKRGRPVTKVFQVERTQEIYVVLDSSRLSARSVVQSEIRQTALERAITAALVLLRAAESVGDRFGLITYNDRVRLLIRAGRGEGHYGVCRESMLELQPSELTPDVPEIIRHLRTQLRRRALLFFLTDLTDPVLAEDFVKHIGLLSRQHLVLVGQIRAPEIAPLFAGAEVTDEGEIYDRLAGHIRWTEGRELAQRLKHHGVTLAPLENESMAAQLVSQYMQVKRRQIL